MTTDISNFSQASSNVTFLHTSCDSEIFLQEHIEGKTLAVSYSSAPQGLLWAPAAG